MISDLKSIKTSIKLELLFISENDYSTEQIVKKISDALANAYNHVKISTDPELTICENCFGLGRYYSDTAIEQICCEQYEYGTSGEICCGKFLYDKGAFEQCCHCNDGLLERYLK